MSKKVFIAIPRITEDKTIESMRKQALEAGFTAVFAKDIEATLAQDATSEIKCAAVCSAMKSSDLLIANLTPFLSVEPDPDVTFQLGYMAAQRKPVFSYSNISKPFYQRVKDWNGKPFELDEQRTVSGTVLLERDRDMMRIENMGIKSIYTIPNPGPDNYNNLMLEGPSTMTGSEVLIPKIADVEISEAEIYCNTDLFKHAISTARQQVLIEGKIQAEPAPAKLETANACYLAGPGVFLPNLLEYFADAKMITQQHHIMGIAPIDAQLDFGEMQKLAMENGNNPQMRKKIYCADTGVMQSVRIGIFNLTPHHGVAADSGTIFEMGYMVGKDHNLDRTPMVFGFSTTHKKLAERETTWHQEPQGPRYGSAEAVADPSIVYSTMIDGAIIASGGSLAHRPTKEIEAARGLTGYQQYAHLEEFQQCVTSIAQQLGIATAPAAAHPAHHLAVLPHHPIWHNPQQQHATAEDLSQVFHEEGNKQWMNLP